MSTLMARSPDTHANGSAQGAGAQLLVSVPDSERLLLQFSFVRNQPEAEIFNELEARIRGAHLLDPSEVPPDLVTMNSRVLLRDLDRGRLLNFTLVFPSRANARKGRISILTPLGLILLGARTGQQITCPVSGTISLAKIVAILHQPEAAGDYYG